MKPFTNSLDSVSVAAPCPADWDAMIGDARVRFCGRCELNVYNLSAMSQREAESLIARTEGRLCLRFYRRKDGSIITEDCPVGLRKLKLRASKIKRAVVSALFGFLAAVGFHGMLRQFGSFLPSLVPRPEVYGHTTGVMADPRIPRSVIEQPISIQGRHLISPPRPVSKAARTKVDSRS